MITKTPVAEPDLTPVETITTPAITPVVVDKPKDSTQKIASTKELKKPISAAVDSTSQPAKGPPLYIVKIEFYNTPNTGNFFYDRYQAYLDYLEWNMVF